MLKRNKRSTCKKTKPKPNYGVHFVLLICLINLYSLMSLSSRLQNQSGVIVLDSFNSPHTKGEEEGRVGRIFIYSGYHWQTHWLVS